MDSDVEADSMISHPLGVRGLSFESLKPGTVQQNILSGSEKICLQPLHQKSAVCVSIRESGLMVT